MKLVPMDVTPAHAAHKRKHKTKNQRLAEDFLAAGYTCAMVQEHEWLSEHEAVNSLNTTFRRRGYPITAFAHNGSVFLKRKEDAEWTQCFVYP